MLQKFSFIGRSVVQHGEDGVAVRVPNRVRDELGIEPGDEVDLEYDREQGTLTTHARDGQPSKFGRRSD